MKAIQCAGALVAVGLLTTACVTHQTSINETRWALAKGPHVTKRGAAIIGMTAMTWGDKWAATNLLERATAQDHSPNARFNLAAGYHATGRVADALPIYRSVVIDGFNAWAETNEEQYDPAAKVRRVNLSEESARRIQAIVSTPGYVEQVVPPIDYKALARQSTAEPEGVPKVGRVSDRKAMEIDAAIRKANGR